MWILVLIGGIALIVAHAVYFSGRLTRAVADLVPGWARALRRVRIGYLAVAVSLPLVIVVYAIYLAIVRPETSALPGGWLFRWAIDYPFWLVTIWSLQCSLLIAPLDLVHLGLRACKLARGARWLRGKNALVAAIAAMFAVYVPIQIALARGSLHVRTYRYDSPALPAALDGYRIVAIGDLQADPDTGPARLAQLVDAVNRANPDLVLIAGDLITRGPDYIQTAADAVASIRARDAVYSCIGDHDNWVYFNDPERSVRAVTEALARAGVIMLDDRVARVEAGGASIAIIVATNNYIRHIDRATARALVAEAQSSDLQVALAHQAGAQLVAEARAGGVDLFVSGHTHGGQVRFWTPFGDLSLIRIETRYVSGPYRLGDMLLVVTNGLGVSVAPFRYRAPATLEVIDLHRR